MRSLAWSLALAVVAGAALAAPAPTRTRAVLPPLEALHRLGLRQQWQTVVPVANERDGIGTAQVLDFDPGAQLVVQTQSGGLFALDGDTGALQFRQRLTAAYPRQLFPVAFNSRQLFAVADLNMKAFDRVLGNLDWTMAVPHVLSGPPVADEDQLYFGTTDGRIHLWILPLPPALAGKPGKPKPGGLGPTFQATRAALRMPESAVDLQLIAPIPEPPVVTPTHMVLANSKGALTLYHKELKVFTDTYAGTSPLTAPMGQLDRFFYAATEDHNLIAFEVEGGKQVVNWKYLAGTRITQRPAVVGEDLYAAAAVRGLLALSRRTGDLEWENAQAKQFVAASKRFVYARDDRGRLLVLDRTRGITLARWDDASTYAIVPANEVSDRVYLTNHDGTVICLADATQAKPLYANRPLPPAAKPADAAAPAEDKPAEEKPAEKPAAKPAKPAKPGDKKDDKKGEEMEAKPGKKDKKDKEEMEEKK